MVKFQVNDTSPLVWAPYCCAKGSRELDSKQRQTLNLLTYNLMRAVGEEKESR